MLGITAIAFAYLVVIRKNGTRQPRGRTTLLVVQGYLRLCNLQPLGGKEISALTVLEFCLFMHFS